jgi:hypothetical protein
VLFLCYLHIILNVLFLDCNYTRMASASVEEVVGGVAFGVEAGPAVAPAAPASAAAPAGPMRWNNATSGFVLRRMAQLVSDGSRLTKSSRTRM